MNSALAYPQNQTPTASAGPSPETLATYPLASVQQAIWFDQMLHPDMPCYNIGTIFRLDGELDPALLEAAIHEVAHAHDGLRLRLHRDGDLAVQQVMPRIDFELPCHDFSAHADAGARSEQHLRAVFGTPFALHGGRLWASQLVRIGPTRHHWLFYGHHVILDGFSCTHVMALVLASYRRRVRGDPSASPAGTSYREFLVDDRAYLDSPRYKRDAQFWNERFSRMPAPLLVADLARRGAQAVRVPSVPWEIDRGLYARLETFAAAAGGSVPHCLLALLAVLFSRTHATDEVVIGVPVHNRTARDRLTLGMFSSVIPVRIAVDPDRPFALLMRDIAAELRSCYRHQRYPIADLNRTLNLARHGRPQLFDITLAMASFSGLIEQGTPAWTALYLHNGFEQTPLALRLCDYNAGEPVTLEFNHNVAFLDRAAVEVIRRRFEHLLHAVLADGGAQPAGALALLDPAEREQVLVHWNHTVPARAAGLCIHQRFEAQVRRTPQAIALVHGARTLSYQALNTRANRLARQLRAHGIGPDRLVALCMERSPALVVAILAVFKAGGAYVPLDPAHASARLGAILDDSQPALLLLDHAGRNAVGEMADRFTAIDLQADDADDGLDDADDLPPDGLAPQHLAYVIYTSGSTGQPKGVMVEHAQVARLFDATRQRFRFGSQDVWSLFHSFAFDFSVWEIWGALLHGGRLVVVPTAIARAPDAFYELLCEQGVTVLNQTPGAFRQLVAAQAQTTRAHRLRCVVFGGEALEPHTLKPWFARNDPAATQLFNMYGITETTVHVTCHALQAADADRAGFSPIGVRLPHLRVYILDARMQPVPIGVEGELYIGGDGVARGYLHRPALTAERFLDDPFVPGARLYRSGDLGRWLSDGSIEYLGRNDQQVKIRGFRIEPGEIEAHLARVPGVREVVVLAREDAPGDVRLVAYYTGADALQADALRQHAAQGLPPYMVPAAYVALAALPLTPNGKLDRKALPAPEDQAFSRSAYEAPQGPDEQALATLWAELLGIDRVGRHDNFFELGGHSLLAVRMVARLHQLRGIDMPLGDVFAAPELAQLAERMRNMACALPEPIRSAEREGPAALSPAQQRLWLLTQMDGAGQAYHMCGALRLRGALEPDLLHRALARVVQRHEALRTCFRWVGEQPMQCVEPADRFMSTALDLRAETDPETAARRLRAHAARPFSLADELPIRVLLLRLQDDVHVLQLVMHHIVSDGWSVGVLLNELSQIYTAYQQDRPDPLPPLPIQYADFSAWQRQQLDAGRLQHQSAFWRDQLQGAPAHLTLPTDRPHPPVQDHAGGSLPVRIDAPLAARLNTLGRRHGATLYATLLAGWAALLARLGGQEEVVIGSPVAGRHRMEVEPLVGCFVNTLALRIALRGDPTVAQLLARTQAQVLAGQQHQDLPFDQVVEALQPDRSRARTPLFQVMFAWQNTPAGRLQLPGVAIEPFDTPATTAQFELTLSLQETEAGIVGDLGYATALFDRDTVQRILARWIALLGAMAEHEDHAVACLDILPAAEREQVLVRWNDTAQAYPCELCVHQRFEAQVRRTPQATALVHGARTLSYQALNTRANRLARQLRAQGIGPDRLVALCLERSPALVVAILAVLKAGGAYVPLDPAHASARLGAILDDSRPALLLLDHTGRVALGQMPRRFTVVDVGADDAGDGRDDADDLPPDGLAPQHLAYVIYTSGSTGQPKGVMVEHRSLHNLVAWHIRAFGLHAGSRSAGTAGLGFDASVWELWPTLCSGGCLAMPPVDVARHPQHVLQWWAAQPLDVGFLVTPLAELAYATGRINPVAHTVLIGGERLRRWPDTLPVSQALVNNYGPTETTVVATSGRLHAGDSTANIGRPIANTRVYILDSRMQPVPIGVEGELYIGGDGVARGYLHRPALTAERFLDDPFVPGARLYRSGDLGRWLSDGSIEYLGRNDQQVKIRGFRIEPGEIEAHLAQVPGVREVVVLAREDVPGDVRLVAYYTGAATLQPDALRQHAAQGLPPYMVPAAYVALAALPLTPNGKLDRKALPAPEDPAFARSAYEAPQGPDEQALATLWAELLGIDRVGSHDNFFELGGHSLLAVRMVARLQDTLGVEVVLGKLFANARLLDFASAIAEARQAALPAHLTAFRRTGQALPVFFVNPVTGEVGYVRGLLPGIDANVPVYGLTAIGFLAGERPLYAVPAMAAAYVEAIRHVQPRGPYRLAGWSAGGTVAYEMAHQLLGAGETVGFLGMIDTPSPWSDTVGPTHRVHEADPSIGILGHLLECEPDTLRVRLKEMAVSRDSVRMKIAAQAVDLLPADLPAENAMRHLAVWHGMLSALAQYLPPPLPVTITLFAAAQERKIDWTRTGWSRLVEREIHIAVGGDHMSMMDRLHAKDLGSKISQALAGGPPGDQIVSSAAQCAPRVEIPHGTAARTGLQPLYAATVSVGAALAGEPGPDACPSA